MLITSALNNNSNGYSIVNKDFLTSYIADYNSGYTKCAVANINTPVSGTCYQITHSLGTQNIILNAYILEVDGFNTVEVSYAVPDTSTVMVSVDNVPANTGTLRVVMVGALNTEDASVSVVAV